MGFYNNILSLMLQFYLFCISATSPPWLPWTTSLFFVLGGHLEIASFYATMLAVAFSSCARILGECSTIHPCLHFFFKVEISLCKLIPLFRPGWVHRGSASWDDCNRVSPDELCVSWFLDSFPHSAWTGAESAHSDFGGSRVYAY